MLFFYNPTLVFFWNQPAPDNSWFGLILGGGRARGIAPARFGPPFSSLHTSGLHGQGSTKELMATERVDLVEMSQKNILQTVFGWTLITVTPCYME